MIPAIRVYFWLIVGMIISLVLGIWLGISFGITSLIIYDIVILGLMITDGTLSHPDRVLVTRDLIGRLSIGRDNVISISVKTSDRPAIIQISDHHPIDFIANKSILSLEIRPNTTQNIQYTVNPKQRGEYQWGIIQVKQLSRWGLTWMMWKIDQTQKVPVYPDLIGLRELSIKLTLQTTGTMRQNRRKFGIGTEFAELRQYRQGDDPRFIDWKATAKRGALSTVSPLQIRVLEPEQEQTLIILLDRGRLMTAKVKGLKRFDWGLNATLSLALAGINRGDRVGVAVFDKDITRWIPPERGQHHLNKLIEYLTPIQPILLEPDYVGAVTKLVNQQTRRALVVLITDIVDTTASAELLGALSRLTPRYLPFCVTLRDPLIDQIAHHSITGSYLNDEHPAYAKAVALDLLAQRQVAFANLKQKGVLVLDAPANNISEQLVDRYLGLKSRNQL